MDTDTMTRELLDVLLDVLCQPCMYTDRDGQIRYSTFGLSAYEVAVDMLAEDGYVQRAVGDHFVRLEV